MDMVSILMVSHKRNPAFGCVFCQRSKTKNKTKTTHTQKDDTITEYMSIELLYPNSELSVTEIKQTIGSN